MNVNEKLKRNISISYLYNFLFQLNITSAIWVLYLSFKGMSLIEIGFLESIYHITGVLFELPTGAIADVYGKKFSIITGRIVSVISGILIITSNSFWGFGLSFILSAASMNLNSGAGEALIYDSLKELGEEERYKKIWGNLAFIMSIGQGIAVLLGGILSDIKFLYAYILGMIIHTVALIVACKFNEPTVRKKQEEKKQENLILYQVLISAKVLKTRKVVLYLILFSALVGSLQTTVFFYSQQYFSNMSYSKTAIAIICAASSFIEAISSKYAYKLENLLKLKGTLISVSLINIFSLIGLALAKELAVVFFMSASITGGLAYTIFSDYINSRIPSEYRATILSFDSFCFSMFMISVFPVFGLLAEKIGFTITFGIMALSYIPAMTFLLLKLRKYKSREKVRGIENDRISFE
ncbi:MFS transporter [Clostridium chromiireducens]|uniref:Major facilitator superfamily protein n=1 Tax=Clostridium chromiireducens TaxID=225345 RepID=A0A1V4J0Q3_9CLOT|nr:MFS transporter [Clostridium chromiireducens]OPJ65756.1 major facilitator superfamily protein [Clostridium chromiireducens]